VPMSVAAIILAAGASRRLGQPKQLLKYRGETLLERALRLAGEAGAAPVLVVLGAQFETIRATVSFNDAITVYNEQWQQGLSSTIHAGIRALAEHAPHATGALLMGCDQPRLTASHLRALLVSFAVQTTPSIVFSSYAGARGIPAVFPRGVFDHLQALEGDRGARSLLAQPVCPVIELPFDGGEVDIDQAADLAHLE
jgi:molybdenum cofactor cytidylyltransferase